MKQSSSKRLQKFHFIKKHSAYDCFFSLMPGLGDLPAFKLDYKYQVLQTKKKMYKR